MSAISKKIQVAAVITLIAFQMKAGKPTVTWPTKEELNRLKDFKESPYIPSREQLKQAIEYIKFVRPLKTTLKPLANALKELKQYANDVYQEQWRLENLENHYNGTKTITWDIDFHTLWNTCRYIQEQGGVDELRRLLIPGPEAHSEKPGEESAHSSDHSSEIPSDKPTPDELDTAAQSTENAQTIAPERIKPLVVWPEGDELHYGERKAHQPTPEQLEQAIEFINAIKPAAKEVRDTLEYLLELSDFATDMKEGRSIDALEKHKAGTSSIEWDNHFHHRLWKACRYLQQVGGVDTIKRFVNLQLHIEPLLSRPVPLSPAKLSFFNRHRSAFILTPIATIIGALSMFIYMQKEDTESTSLSDN